MTAAGMKIVPVQSGNWEIDGGNKVAAGMLSEYPNLKAILAGNDSMALGAVSAIRAAGKVGKVQVVGYDNIAAVKAMLSDVTVPPPPNSPERPIVPARAAAPMEVGAVGPLSAMKA